MDDGHVSCQGSMRSIPVLEVLEVSRGQTCVVDTADGRNLRIEAVDRYPGAVAMGHDRGVLRRRWGIKGQDTNDALDRWAAKVRAWLDLGLDLGRTTPKAC